MIYDHEESGGSFMGKLQSLMMDGKTDQSEDMVRTSSIHYLEASPKLITLKSVVQL